MMKYCKWSIYLLFFFVTTVSAQMTINVAIPLSMVIDKNTNETIENFSLELLKNIAINEGWSLNFTICRYEKCYELLESGVVDVLPLAVETEYLRNSFVFTTNQIHSDWPILIGETKTKIKTLNDLDGKRIAIIYQGMHSENYIKSFKDFGIDVNYFFVKDRDELISSLHDGRADMAIITRMLGTYLKERNSDLFFSDLLLEPYGIKYAVYRDHNQFIINRIDEVIGIYRSMDKSDYKKLIKKLLYPATGNLEYERDRHLIVFILQTGLIAVLLIVIYVLFSWYRKLRDSMSSMEVIVAGAKKVKSDFLANMSHEVRTPLNAIMGMTEVLLDSPLSLKQKRHLEMIKGGSENLLIILNDILDLSRIESGDIHINQFQGNIRSLCEDVVNLASLRFAGKDIGVTLDVAKDVPIEVVTDHVRLRHVLANLLSNAGKFTDDGDVLLKVYLGNDNFLIFDIIDTGKGMSQDILEDIFIEFWQEDFSSKKKYGGTGMGLSITKMLVKLLGGSIDVVSEEGAGSTFTVRLPIEREINKHDHDNFPDLTDGKIAIVTTKDLERKFVKDNYSKTGCTVDEFSSLDQDFWDNIKSYDKIFLEYNFIYTYNEISKSILDKISVCLDKIIIIFTIGAEAALIREFSHFGMTKYIIRPLSKSKIFSKEYDSNLVSCKKGIAKKILIIDDDPDYRIILEDLIVSRFDFAPVSVGSGQDGFEVLENQKIDLVILDVKMDDMSGIDFFNSLKERKINVPVLFLTGHYLDEHLLDNIEGMYLYLDKCDGVNAVIKSIEQLIEVNESMEVDKTFLTTNKKTVLVVDDSNVNIALIEVMLSGFDFYLVSGINGREAFELYIEHRPDLVLMDLQMPEVDGYQAIENIRDYEKEHGIADAVPILAISAYALENEIARAFHAGCNEYLSKPIKKKQLLSVIDDLLNR